MYPFSFAKYNHKVSWILFFVFSLCCAVFSYKYFSHAFPIVDLNLTMDRTQAIEKAAHITKNYKLGPEAYHEAASFNLDSQVKNYVELELGGAAAFKKMLQEPYFAPYQWAIRHFKEYTIHEVTLYFTPDGIPYGFKEIIAESEPGAALSGEQAQDIAQHHAATEWNIDFSQFTLVEKSDKKQPSGRIDYTFVYERNNSKLGEAPYRLTLQVSGDKLTQVLHSVKVPEDFIRRYQEMRSSNTTISFSALFFVVLLYVIGCGIFGFIVLMRRHAFLWQPPLLWALLIGIGKAIDVLNSFPLRWNFYQTELSLYNFVGTILLGFLMTLLGYTVFAYIVLLLAEGLTRLAFGQHPRLWNAFWQAYTYAYAKRFLIGYIIVPIMIAFVIFFYLLTSRYLAWWLPSDSLYEPIILATYVPWWSPFIDSLSAGMLEECLFRAIPLSCAALLGNRFGKRSWWIASVFILQAIIFGAAHASYATQPAYARLVELIIPSFIFGGMYLIFGLIPSILSHVLYDILWMSLPLFVSTAFSSRIYQACILLISSLPLLIIAYRRIKHGHFAQLASLYYNKHWQPIISEKRSYAPLTKPVLTMSSMHRLVILALTVLSVLMSGNIPYNKKQPLSRVITRTHALHIIENMHIPGTWASATTIMLGLPKDKDIEMQHIYVWRTAGKKAYIDLLEQYLYPHRWVVRLAKFEGSQQERAEEHFFMIGNDQNIIEHRHQIPEHVPMQSLSMQQAQAVAYQHLQQQYNLLPQDFTVISTISTKQPERTDWTITVSVPSPLVLDQGGETRIAIVVTGDQVTDSYKFVFVPETWQRSYREEQTLFATIRIVCLLILFMLLACAGYIVLRYWPSKPLWFHGILFGSLLLIKSLIQSFNIWPSIIFNMDTAQPFWHQTWMTIGIFLMSTLFKAGFFGSLISLWHGTCTSIRHASLSWVNCFLYGTAAGCIIGGIQNMLIIQGPKLAPVWPDFTAADAYSAWLSNALLNLTTYIESTVFLLLIVLFLDYLFMKTPRKHIGLIWCILFGILSLVAGNSPLHMYWILAGTLMGIVLYAVYALIWKYHPATVPATMLAPILAQPWKLGIEFMYPGALLGAIVSTILLIIIVFLWIQLLLDPKASK